MCRETDLDNRTCNATRAEGALAELNSVQHRYEQMLANSATAAVCAGPDNLIVSWNTAAEQLFGYTAEQAIGQPLSIIIPPRLRSAHDAGLARAVQSGHARLAGHSVDILALHANGTEIPVDLSLAMWLEEGEARCCQSNANRSPHSALRS
jgi:PAS domain S-box-containing protein